MQAVPGWDRHRTRLLDSDETMVDKRTNDWATEGPGGTDVFDARAMPSEIGPGIGSKGRVITSGLHAVATRSATVLGVRAQTKRFRRDTGADGICDLGINGPRARPAPLHRVLTEAMTIRETSFFRDLQPFRLLRDRVIPELIEARKRERRLYFWSAASSTGQEAYSLAMLVREYFPQVSDWDVQILGTDISQLACDYARRGHYTRLEIHHGLPDRFLLRYFVHEGDGWRVMDDVRRMVCFERGNLCEPAAAELRASRMKFDVVLLRNVLLYFAEEDRARVLLEVYGRMRTGSALLLGNSEQAEDSTDRFRGEFDQGSYFYRPLVVG